MKRLIPILILFFITNAVYAQGLEYTPLAPIPQLTNSGGNVDINSFLPGLVKFGISIATGLAVIFIIIGGFKYATTDAWGQKTDAKETIQNAFFGLLMAIGAYAILYTVNPQLVQFSLTTPTLKTAGEITMGLGAGSGGECLNCIPVPTSIPHKTAAERGCAYEPCLLHATLVNRLGQLKTDMSSIGWQVTEVYPPTVTHIDSCHSNGSCFDGKLLTANGQPPSVEAIKVFLENVSRIFGEENYEYEVPNDSRRNSLKNNPALSDFKDRIKVESSTTGESIHVELGESNTSNVGCTNTCVTLDPNSIPTQPTACPDKCYLNRALDLKLRALTAYMKDHYGWNVIQAYPPILTESSINFQPGSKSGTAVDVALTTALDNIDAIKFFLDKIKTLNITSYKYNVCDQDRVNRLKNDPKLVDHKTSFGQWQCSPVTHPEGVRIIYQ